ncbi:bifunctional folylpolyglutamate synthase/dihydrofolate synthase [Mediannikoviicoccus vaginalis]|uniref:bifunctional folylpolyglutamate synthase/dihydrofolate synthase n=1 Tax=Mediannikoviicoccus vaginalis TaxID=2899727 RepID=UPI001EFF1821|nr:Mur ligase family protein [Mediannikoviicoccus vaginalis]
MKYKQALDLIENVNYGHSEDSSNFKRVLAKLELNIDEGKTIQIAGTNGKGSVGTFLSTLLKEQGYKVMHFSSPHLEKYEERIKIDLKPISQELLIKNVEEILEKITIQDLKNLNYFEVSFLLALKVFDNEGPDYFIIETGIGGRFDITNIFDSNLLSIITTIDFDHQDRLGNTLEDIAYHKAGIIKDNGKVISFEHKDFVDEVILKEAKTKDANIKFLKSSDYFAKEISPAGSKFQYMGIDFETKVLGSYQISNICLAILALNEIIKSPNIEKIKSAVKELYFEGRMEVLKKNPLIIVDGAHNYEGIRALKENVERLNLKDFNLVIGSMKDKDIICHLEDIIKFSKRVIITKIDYERAMEPKEFAKKLKEYNKEIVITKSVEEACNYIRDRILSEEKIIITGSLYLIGEFKKILKDE